MKKMLGRILSLALCILMIATSIGVYTAGVFAAGNTIYVSSGGNDANAGTSIDTAVKTRENTGLNKITLIGAAVSDYSQISWLLLIILTFNYPSSFFM